jgi:hypothetical protein
LLVGRARRARAWPASDQRRTGVCARIVDRERQFCLSLVLTEYRQLLEIDSGVREGPFAKSGGTQRLLRSLAGGGVADHLPTAA